jgi:hypothetical protein
VTEGATVSRRASAANTAGGRVGRIRLGISKLFGFGLSVLVLGVASFAAIPAMIAADGKVAWGAIALGQTIGTSGAVVAGYGWGLFGPARVAGAAAAERRLEYLESIHVRMILLLPVALVAACLALILAPAWRIFAAVGAVSATTMGLTASWYFVGVARPYAMLVLETIPRVGGTAAGIVLMRLGHSAVVLPGAMCAGMIAGFAISTSWVFCSTAREGAGHVRPRALRVVLSSHRHGLASDTAMATYAAAPLMIVSAVAPGLQPVFALADKVQAQSSVALAPARTVLQAWVPRASGSARARRAQTALELAAVFAVVVGVGMVAVLPGLMGWLGNGQISVSKGVVLLVAACVSLSLFVRTFELTALAPFERLDVVARAIVVSSIIGLPMVALGAVFLGTIGALSGVLVGLLVCLVVESAAYFRCIRPLSRDITRARVQ